MCPYELVKSLIIIPSLVRLIHTRFRSIAHIQNTTTSPSGLLALIMTFKRRILGTANAIEQVGIQETSQKFLNKSAVSQYDEAR